ncbi:di-trans,poly-cis-decaprenylcistransferase [Candidatus Woesearchaeota archaeon]|nr:di-trans,poly-cis-decaprenylcistransferase [Candidatus Woesearchaeota archaeon]
MLFKKKKEEFNLAKIPKHIAVNIGGITKWAEKQNCSLSDAFRRSFSVIEDIIKLQVRLGIPILTVYVLPETSKKSQQFSNLLDGFVQFLDKVSFGEIINKNKVKVTVLGKWYDLPGRVVEHIKSVIEETKDYDSFFVNFCVNYDGREEIVDACKLIARQVSAKKISPERVDKVMIKENLYSSYFIPPDIIIKNGARIEQGTLLLWDSPHAHLYFSEKLFPDISRADILKAIRDYQRNR